MSAVNNTLTLLDISKSNYENLEFTKLIIRTPEEVFHINDLNMHASFIYNAENVTIILKSGESLNISGEVVIYYSLRQCVVINKPTTTSPC